MKVLGAPWKSWKSWKCLLEDDSDSDHDPLGLAEASQHEVKELLTGRPHGSEQTSRYAFTCACISLVLPQHLPTRCSICRNICRHPSFSAAMSHYAATSADTHLFLPQHLPQIFHVLPQHLPQITIILPQHLAAPSFFCRNICRQYLLFCRNICRHGS